MSDSEDSATQRPPSMGASRAETPRSASTPAVVSSDEVADVTYVEGSGATDAAEGYRVRHAGLRGAGRWVRFVLAGGMGAVVEVAGEDRGDGSGLDAGERRFALKMVKDSLLQRVAVVERFRRELLSHRRLTVDLQATRLVPCIAVLRADADGAVASVAVTDVVDDASDPRTANEIFGLFPFFPEGSLETCLERGLSKGEALFVVADAVEGLQSLHGHRYVHRDFHPSNILVEREGGRPRGLLGDLGVGMFQEANTIFSKERVEADRGHRVGHPGYIDPTVRASPHADLYAVGVTLYRILTGAVPSAVSSGPFSLPSSKEYSSAFRQLGNEVLAGLTAPAVDDRFASAREVRGAVVRLAERLPSPAMVSVTGHPSAPVASHAPVVPVAQQTRPAVSRMGASVAGGRRRWRRLVAVPLAALVFAAVGFGGWRLVRSEPVGESVEGAALGAGTVDPTLQGLLDPELPDESPNEAEEHPAAPVTNSPEVEPESSSQTAPPPRSPTPPPSTSKPPRRIVAPAPPPPPAPVPPRVVSPPPAAPAVVSSADLAEVDKALREGRRDHAQSLLEGLRAAHPGDPDVATRLAVIFLRDREVGPGMARRVLSPALKAHPERGDLRVFLARVLRQIGREEEASRVLQQAPTNSTHREDIDELRVTLERAKDPK